MKNHQNICPICHSTSLVVRELDSPFILSQLEKYYAEKIEADLSLINYQVRKCNACSLEFASPMQAGSGDFYTWITNHQGYYPNGRWEWQEVLNQIHNQNAASANLLEIGCGTGRFLESAQKSGVTVVGLDTTLTSVEQCKSNGFETYSSTLQEFIKSDFANKLKFDYVVSFHCLEHVDDPKALVEEMSSVLKPTGSIFLSTPYSPMSFETIWFDPLNYPPHHLTRWNAQSYKELAKQLNMSVKLFMSPAPKLIDRVLSTLNYTWNGPAHVVGRRQIMLKALTNPLFTLSEVFRQLKRERLNNQVAADVVLVELKIQS